ncbi:MAG: efflux transporter periplasmic adaptor subunit [Massilia sp.]|nr:efflux transporter periplasmic adaptor subunit [Massilia sp.]
MVMKFSLRGAGRVGTTLIAAAGAIHAGWRLWHHYEIEPWTRDGRVKAYVVQVAPDVTGQVTKVYVHDNQQVNPGDVLFEVDRARFELALRQAEAAESAAQAALRQAEREARRNVQLDELVAQETREQGQSRVEQARAALAQAVVSRDTARLNLERTRVVSVVGGSVTNLDLRAGTYVSAGHPVVALVDRGSFYVEGYFEETKLPAIHLGDPVAVSLMGAGQKLTGHVESFAEGISDRDRSTGTNMLPNINPTFNWVRLAQRIPVRVALDRIPANVRLVAGQTATVQVLPATSRQGERPAAAQRAHAMVAPGALKTSS